MSYIFNDFATKHEVSCVTFYQPLASYCMSSNNAMRWLYRTNDCYVLQVKGLKYLYTRSVYLKRKLKYRYWKNIIDTQGDMALSVIIEFYDLSLSWIG